MSGGSWNYIYERMNEASAALRDCKCPYRKALGKQLAKIALAMHDIEWVDSDDYGEGDDQAAIEAALGSDCEKMALAELIIEANDSKERLEKQIEIAKGITCN